MKKLLVNKRAMTWLGISALWVVVFIITLMWPNKEWLIPATGLLSRRICAFDTGESIFDVYLIMVLFATSIMLFMKGKEKIALQVSTDITTGLVAIQLLYLGTMRINSDLLANDWGIYWLALDVISRTGIFWCIVFSAVLLIKQHKKCPTSKQEQGEQV